MRGQPVFSESELTSGLYYGYAVIDVPTLVSNLTGSPAKKWLSPDVDRTLPAEVASRLLHLIATVSPGAKKGSTAPYAYAETMLLEAGNSQPRTLSNAFRNPVSLRNNVSEEAVKALSKHLAALDQVYGKREARAGFCVGGHSSLIEFAGGAGKTLVELSDWVKNAVATGRV